MYALFLGAGEEGEGMLRKAMRIDEWLIVQVSPRTIPHAPISQSRHRSNDARDDREDRSPREGKLMGDLMADIENGDKPLDERLANIGIDPVEYKAYGNYSTDYIYQR